MAYILDFLPVNSTLSVRLSLIDCLLILQHLKQLARQWNEVREVDSAHTTVCARTVSVVTFEHLCFESRSVNYICSSFVFNKTKPEVKSVNLSDSIPAQNVPKQVTTALKLHFKMHH
jgi:hypothetical protein